ncbi:MAG: hypothetical protein QNJ64_21050, partial [Crocosphaera sp.]|nr:hypothetical protein [Crocosphaera sp.]
MAKPLIAPLFAPDMAIGGDFWAFSTFNPSSLQEKTKSDLDKKSDSLESQNQLSFTPEVTKLMPFLPSGYWSINLSRLHQIDIVEPFELLAFNNIDAPELSSLETDNDLKNQAKFINDVETNKQLLSHTEPLQNENKITNLSPSITVSQIDNLSEESIIKNESNRDNQTNFDHIVENENKNLEKEQKLSSSNQPLQTEKKTYKMDNLPPESSVKDENNNQTIYPLVENEDKNLEKEQKLSTLNQALQTENTTYKMDNLPPESSVKDENNNQTIYPLIENEDKNLEKEQKISSSNQALQTENTTYKMDNLPPESSVKDENKHKTIYPLVENENLEKEQKISTSNQPLQTEKKTYKINNLPPESSVKDENNNQTIYPLIENENKNLEKEQKLSTLKQPLQTEKKTYKMDNLPPESIVKDENKNKTIYPLIENEDKNLEKEQKLSTLKQPLQTEKKTYKMDNLPPESIVKDENKNKTI